MLVVAAARRRSHDSMATPWPACLSILPPPCTDAVPVYSDEDEIVCAEATWCKGLPARAGNG